MPADAILALFGDVRRQLWRQHWGSALRRGLWGTAGACLLAAAAHLLIGPVPAPAWAAAGLAWWAGWLAWAAGRRPADAACALWADRHLGGASAFSTWLELRAAGAAHPPDRSPARPGTTDPRVAAWLDAWVQARLPDAGRQLAARRPALGLGRPLAASLVCAALAGFVLAGPSPTAGLVSRPAASSPVAAAPAAAPPSGPASLPAAPTAALQDLAGDLSRTLRERPPAGSASRRPDSRDAATGAGRPAAAADPAAPGDARAAAGGAATPAPGASPAAAADSAGTAAVAPTATGAGTGQGAGSGLDRAAPAPATGAAAPGLAVQLRPWAGPGQPAQRQADMAQAGTYDDLQTLRRTAGKPLPAPAAATAPAAGPEQVLSPAEARYVQAWTQALTRHSR